ncbi:ATP-grasp fold amidoligase family protein [Streptococcus cameli]
MLHINDDQKHILKAYKIRFISAISKFLSSEKYIKFQYKNRTGKQLNLLNPQTYNEKLQLYKLQYHNELMHQCVDKIEVRDFVIDKLGFKRANEILIPLLAYGDSIESIDWDKLPNKFIVKLSNGSSFNKIIPDKNSFDKLKISKLFGLYSKIDYYAYGREWAYKDVKNRVLVEELLEFGDAIPDDYRFFCFNGKVEFITVDSNSVIDGIKNTNYTRNIYDRQWNKLDASIRYPNNPNLETRPERLTEMIDIAEKLSSEFPHARIDFYYFDNKIYFGEITFYHASGYQKIEPNEFDIRIGKLFEISN